MNISAMKQYNGVPLDGRSMHILMATSEVSARPRGSQLVPRSKSFDGPRRYILFFKPRQFYLTVMSM